MKIAIIDAEIIGKSKHRFHSVEFIYRTKQCKEKTLLFPRFLNRFRKVKTLENIVFTRVFVWLPLLGLNQRHHD